MGSAVAATLRPRSRRRQEADDAVDDLDGVGGDRADVGLIAGPSVALVAEVVQRADDVFADDHAVGERSALVGAKAVDREHAPAARAEDGDELVADAEGTAQADGDVAQGGELNQSGGSGERHGVLDYW